MIKLLLQSRLPGQDWRIRNRPNTQEEANRLKSRWEFEQPMLEFRIVEEDK
jgi:hypothetical protein